MPKPLYDHNILFSQTWDVPGDISYRGFMDILMAKLRQSPLPEVLYRAANDGVGFDSTLHLALRSSISGYGVKEHCGSVPVVETLGRNIDDLVGAGHVPYFTCKGDSVSKHHKLRASLSRVPDEFSDSASISVSYFVSRKGICLMKYVEGMADEMGLSLSREFMTDLLSTYERLSVTQRQGILCVEGGPELRPDAKRLYDYPHMWSIVGISGLGWQTVQRTYNIHRPLTITEAMSLFGLNPEVDGRPGKWDQEDRQGAAMKMLASGENDRDR